MIPTSLINDKNPILWCLNVTFVKKSPGNGGSGGGSGHDLPNDNDRGRGTFGQGNDGVISSRTFGSCYEETLSSVDRYVQNMIMVYVFHAVATEFLVFLKT